MLKTPPPPRAPEALYRRIERKLGLSSPIRSDWDLARLVRERMPIETAESLTNHGLSEAEVYSFILPRRTLAHRRNRSEDLTMEESDKAVRIARITSLADEVFGDDEKAGRWLRKPKQRFDNRCPLEMLRTEAGARIVEEMLQQLDYGFFA
jgi:putative toxin-antitoxin system antitoxin component (TIGR02293 family)